jgi:ADP-heptose:LPS heptosyltransferase
MTRKQNMILIAPYAQKLRNGGENPKNYPYWPELVKILQHNGEHIVQVGVKNELQLVEEFYRNLPMSKLVELLKTSTKWIGVDSYFQHLAWHVGIPGYVLFSQSDPLIFGHPENFNLLKGREYLREKQFWLWEQCPYNVHAYMQPEEVAAIVLEGTKT